MNLREKLGQRLIYALPHVTEMSEEVADFLISTHAAGVILFGFNVKTPEQIARFNRDLQALAAERGLPPFIISLDEEGGTVSRMPAEGQDLITPNQMAQAVAGLDTVRECAAVTARRLRRLGFNLNYTPVLDINNNPHNPVIGIRSFGADPQQVAEAGAVAIQTYLEYGISPCVKHFPGHGDTAVDSHHDLPIVSKSLDELLQFEIVPFKRAIEAGVPSIMTAHIVYPQVEPDGLPATLSPIFLNDVLRNKLGFEGIIITDCLDMRAIADRYGLGAGAIRSFRAGADIAMLKGPLDEQRAAFEEVVAAAEAGGFDATASDATLARLEKWRSQFCLDPISELQPAEDFGILARAARAGMTVTVEPGATDILPLHSQKYSRPLLVDFTLQMASPVEDGRQPSPLLARLLTETLPNLHRFELSGDLPPTVPDELFATAGQSDLLIVIVRNALRFDEQRAVVQRLLQITAPVIVVAAREPYDLDLFPTAQIRVATYGDPPVSMKALVAALTGK